MLINRVYEVDPLACPKCNAQMRVVSFITPLPQQHVIDKILKHCGLWPKLATRAPPEPQELATEFETVYVDIDTSMAACHTVARRATAEALTDPLLGTYSLYILPLFQVA